MKLKYSALLATLLTPFMAFAHPGHSHHETHSFMSGVTHPVTGVDHLIMLVAFGFLIGALSWSLKKSSALVGAGLISLVAGMAIGKMLGFAAIVEPMIVASLFVVSLCLWQVFSPNTKRVNSMLAVSIGLLFFHGYAHGVEAAANLGQFATGMALSATALMTVGVFVSRLVTSKWLSVGVASASALWMLTA
ncbi:HupE/UreJ family protein [Vibrio comitans]|uniref:Urease accessory protein n=1 Tax=Vibrio comitans NBRC 102076 TaxID=1219078 RepID=A0A4Y3IP23_9VIBR|nr:HupE/UreJ family protein [Vibrio comitans]GEA61253.1 urease accessory protein [Vibrio comitans NBRC 102076]